MRGRVARFSILLILFACLGFLMLWGTVFVRGKIQGVFLISCSAMVVYAILLYSTIYGLYC